MTSWPQICFNLNAINHVRTRSFSYLGNRLWNNIANDFVFSCENDDEGFGGIFWKMGLSETGWQILLCLHSTFVYFYKNIEKHTAHTIVSWPNPKQWMIVHTSNLMMIIRQSIYIISIITREMGKLKTHSTIYCIIDNWENMPQFTAHWHTRQNISDRHFISSLSSDNFAQCW